MSSRSAFLWINFINMLVLGGASGQILLPVHLERSGVTRWEIGVVWAAFSLSAIFLRLFIGGWMERWGQLPFYRAGAVVVAFCQCSYAIVHPTFEWALPLRCLEGAALASYFTAVWSRVIDLSPPDKISRFTGLFGISGLFAGAVGPLLLEKVAQAHGYPMAFRFSGGAACLGALCAFTLSELPRSERKAGSDRGFRAVLVDPAMASTVISALLFGITLGSFNTFIAPYAHSLKLSGVGPMFFCYTLASIAIRIGFGGMSDRLHPLRIIGPALMLFAIAMGLLGCLGLKPSLGFLIFSGTLVGSGHGLIYPAISTLALRRASATSNTASAVFTASMDVGALTGASLSGVLSHHRGYPTTFAAWSGVLLVGYVMMVWAERGRSRELEL